MKKHQSIKKYEQKFRYITDKLTTHAPYAMLVEFFMGGLPPKMNKFVRQLGSTTLAVAVTTTKKYVTT